MKQKFLQLLSNKTIGLLFRYGIVGVLASVFHFSVALLFYKFWKLTYFVSHFIGFAFGLITSYLGHYFYSFKDDGEHHKRFPKFFVISLSALLLHQGGAWFLVNRVKLDYSSQVLPLLIITVPLFTFLLNRFWVFSSISPSK